MRCAQNKTKWGETYCPVHTAEQFKLHRDHLIVQDAPVNQIAHKLPVLSDHVRDIALHLARGTGANQRIKDGVAVARFSRFIWTGVVLA
jgi:hypothetical protein